MHVDPATLDAKVAATSQPGRKMQSAADFLLNIIPTTVVDAFAKGDILQVLLFSVLFGFALQPGSASAARCCRRCIETFSHVLFGIVGIIMRARADRRLRRDGVHHRQVRGRLAAARSAS